jgi:hypothetical protein
MSTLEEEDEAEFGNKKHVRLSSSADLLTFADSSNPQDPLNPALIMGKIRIPVRYKIFAASLIDFRLWSCTFL